MKTWATDTEAEAARGRWRDPRRTSVTIGQWRERWARGRAVEAETSRADEGSWRLHLAPTFAGVDLVDLTKAQVQEWVIAQGVRGIGPSATRRALNYLKTLLEGALDEELVAANVARKVDPPAGPRKQPDWFRPAEVSAIAAAFRARGRESHAVMTELMCWVGPRWGEAAGLRGSDVDWLRKTVRIDHVLTQAGKDKAYPKNVSSVREVPVPGWIVESMAALLVGREPGARIFVTRRQGRDLSGPNWVKEFAQARSDAGVGHGTPHTCRHTCASWLVQAGVPLYEVKRQLGHSSMQTTEKYAHLAPDAHAQIVGAWDRLDAQVTHDGLVSEQIRP